MGLRMAVTNVIGQGGGMTQTEGEETDEDDE